jgi:hypothetical protein
MATLLPLVDGSPKSHASEQQLEVCVLRRCLCFQLFGFCLFHPLWSFPTNLFSNMCSKDQDTHGACSEGRRGTAGEPVIFIGTQRFDRVKKLLGLGQIIASDGKGEGEVSGRLGLAYAAFHDIGKRETQKDKAVRRRTKLIMYKVPVQTILLRCAKNGLIRTG